MRDLNSLVPEGQRFNLSDELFLLDPSMIEEISRIGVVIGRFMSAMQIIMHLAKTPHLPLIKSYSVIHNMLLGDMKTAHKKIAGIHPQRNSLLTRVDFMIDEAGCLKIAEIDPMNKHGLGFALACRNESGHGERQKILSLFSGLLDQFSDLTIIISRKDEFFRREQMYFGQKLGEFVGKTVHILLENDQAQIAKRAENSSSCFLDCPAMDEPGMNEMLLKVFENSPKRFLVPPKHWMGSKYLLSFLHEPRLLEILSAFMGEKDICALQHYIPPTFTINPRKEKFVVKKVMSSGAKGVFFNGNAPDKNVIYQEYVQQKKFLLEGRDQYIRLAAHYVGITLGELTVTSSAQVPVHGNSESVNYHVTIKT